MVSKSVLLMLSVVVLAQTLPGAECGVAQDLANVAQEIANGAVGILNVCQTNGHFWEFLSASKTTGQRCVFPFVYKGETYMSCTRRNWFRHWCATAVDRNLNVVEYGECCKCTDWWCYVSFLFGIETHCNALCPCEHGCPS